MQKKREKQRWSRREFLTGAGVAIGLPFFSSLFPGTIWAETVTPPTRLMFMSVPLGFVPNLEITGPGTFQLQIKYFEGKIKGWFPEVDGADYQMPEVHTSLDPYRQHFSFLKGLCNRSYRVNAHQADDVFLTCADTFADASKAFSNTISCDQVAASPMAMGGSDVRYPSLALGIAPQFGGASNGGMSWNQRGVPLSPMQSPARVFDQLFGKDDLPVEARLQRLREKKSILDVTLGQIKNMKRKLNAADLHKLDEVLTAVEGIEKEIQREEKWINVPKPNVTLAAPDHSIGSVSIRHAQAMFDLAHVAFLTDSTRVITYEMPDRFTEVTKFPKHDLNHPEGDSAKVKDAISLDKAMSEQVAYLIKKLCESKEIDGQPLIHHTLAAYGSGVWGPNHGMRSLPIMLIGHGGGKIKQGVTRSCGSSPKVDSPLANLWLTMLQACGVPETDEAGGAIKGADGKPVTIKKFADSTGTLNDLLT